MEGKFAIVMSMLNAYPLGDDLSQLDKWAARGVRMFGFSYVGNNDWADSSRPLPFFNDSPDALGGLSPLGKQAVERLNDLGVIIDVSQMSTKALEQVAALSRAPIVASHSAPRALVDIKRNLSDHEMQLIKDSGGVIQVVGFPAYLRPLSKPTLDKLNALRARFDLPPLEGLDYALMPGDPIITIWPEQRFGEYASALYGILEEEPKAGLKELVDAIDYTVKKVGIDHVGISSDFNDGGGVDGWKDVSEIRNVTAELITRGYSDADIAKLWGGNFLRAWGEVQKRAKPTATPDHAATDLPMNDRRTFLKQAGILAAGLPLLPLPSRSAPKAHRATPAISGKRCASNSISTRSICTSPTSSSPHTLGRCGRPSSACGSASTATRAKRWTGIARKSGNTRTRLAPGQVATSPCNLARWRSPAAPPTAWRRSTAACWCSRARRS